MGLLLLSYIPMRSAAAMIDVHAPTMPFARQAAYCNDSSIQGLWLAEGGGSDFSLKLTIRKFSRGWKGRWLLLFTQVSVKVTDACARQAHADLLLPVPAQPTRRSSLSSCPGHRMYVNGDHHELGRRERERESEDPKASTDRAPH